MKNKFERMTKEERVEALNKFKEQKPVVYSKFKKLRIICTIGIIYSIIAIGVDFYLKSIKYDYDLYNMIIDCFLLVFCVSFIMFSKRTVNKLVNDMITKEIHEEQKKRWEREQLLLNVKERKTKVDKEKTSKKKTTEKKTTTKKTTKKNSK